MLNIAFLEVIQMYPQHPQIIYNSIAFLYLNFQLQEAKNLLKTQVKLRFHNW